MIELRAHGDDGAAAFAVWAAHRQPEFLLPALHRPYQTVLKFRDRIELNAAAKRRLETRLQELKTALRGLGEPG